MVSLRGTDGTEKSLSRTTTSREAARKSFWNCRSVASQAASGMLLTSPIVRQLRPRRSPAGSDRTVSRRRGMGSALPRLFGSNQASRLGGAKRLIEVGDDVVDVLDADREADHLRPHASFLLLRRRHLPMRGRSRMAGERFGVAHIDQPLEQLERIVKRLAGIEAAGDAEREQRRGAPVQILLRQRMIGIVGKARIIHP